MHCRTRCEQTPHLAKRKGEIRVRLLRILVRAGLVQPNLDWVEWVVFEGVFCTSNLISVAVLLFTDRSSMGASKLATIFITAS